MNHSWIIPTVSAAVGVICLAGAVAVWLLGRRHTPRLVVTLAITGTVGLLGTPIGRWLHATVNSLNDLLGHWTGQAFGTAVGFIGAAIAVYFVAIRVWRRTIDDRVVLVAAGLPLLVTLIPGTAGDVVTAVVFGLANGVGYVIGALF